ncbi:MAG: hypothetical protein H0Z34_10860 [Brevibacillus sp.]|nr:hypothetical protein [Brevibacillus sp.]
MIGMVSGAFASVIEEAIGELIFRSDGTSIREELEAAARTAIRTLIIDLDCITEDEGVLAIRSYRRRRPHTRIILLGLNRVPGDPVIARCVSLGIYDIVNIESDREDEEQLRSLILSSLQRQLAQPPATYADAARWEVYNEASLGITRPVKTGRTSSRKGDMAETVVMTERLIGTPVIAITSATRGSGCTYAAIQTARFLQNFGTVACLELQQEDKAGSLPSLSTEEVEGVFQLKGVPHVDFAYVKKTTDVTRRKKYDWVVVDVGCWADRTDEAIDEWERATMGWVTVAPSPWGYLAFLKQMASLFEHRQEWQVFLQHPSAGQEKKIKQGMDEYRVPVFSLPYQPEVFCLTQETTTVLQSAFEEILPKTVEKRGFTFRIPWWRSS